jgi:opacity protein-like surface antigen
LIATLRNRGQMAGMRAMLLCAVAVAVALAVPSAAAAVPRTTPPGLSELDQYSETILGAGGEHTINSSGGGGGGSAGGGGSVLSPSTERKLQQLGPAGQATSRLANSTAPRGKPGASSGNEGSGSAFGALSDAVGGDGDGGLGIWLPLILAAVAALGIGYALLRRRAHQAG